MLKEAKKWIQHLEEILTELSTRYQKSLEEVEDEWEQFWYDGGDAYDQAAWELEAIDAFKESYESQMEEETVDVRISEGLFFNYYSCGDHSFFEDNIAKLHNVVGGRKVNWVRGEDAHTGDTVSEEIFQKYIDLYDAYDAATK